MSRGGHRGPSLHSSSPDKAFHLSHPHGGEERRAHGQHDQHKKGTVTQEGGGEGDSQMCFCLCIHVLCCRVDVC